MSNLQRPSPSAEGHHGEMSSPANELCFATNARRIGIFPPEPIPPYLFNGPGAVLSDAALELQNYLVGLDDGYGGEAIQYVFEFRNDLAISRAILIDALEELVSAGEVESYTIHNEGSRSEMLICVLPTEMSTYYGDDENAEPDWESVELLDHEICDFPLPPVSDERRTRIYSKTNGWCFYCTTTPAVHLDHMHPKSRGGSDRDDNLIGACAPCNIRKNDRTVEEYRAYLAHKEKLKCVSHICFFGELFQ